MYHFQCIDCGKTYKASELEYVCPECSSKQGSMEPTRGVLKVVFDYAAIKKKRREEIPAMLCPLDDINNLPPLKVGPTPLYRPQIIAKEVGLKNLFIKNDTGLPTGSFKDRASSLVVAKARELKKDIIVCASTGNAATALSGMCASVGMKCVIFVPASAPPAKLTQIASYGARLIPVDGTYDDAFELSLAATRKFGWYNRNTAYNPFTIEGKKSVSLEIWEQLGYKAPDKIFIPTGDGVILAGTYKGFYDLLQLGLVDKMPQLIAVQAEGSPAILKMLGGDVYGFENKNVSGTIADSISVSAPRNGLWAVKAIRETKGFGVAVTDAEIIQAIGHMASKSGVFAEPAAAAAFAGLLKMKGRIKPGENVIVLVTGTGLKDIPAAQKGIKIPKAIKPDIEFVIPAEAGIPLM
jgi:threonine synthase